MYKTLTSGIAEAVEETGQCKSSGRVGRGSLSANVVAASGSSDTDEPS